MALCNLTHAELRRLLSGRRLPCALIDLDSFRRNAERLTAPIFSAGKRLRVATKSLRVPRLIEELQTRFGDRMSGCMTYTVEETAFLAGRGLNDFVVAYPTLQSSDLELLAELTAHGTKVRLMADGPEQLAALAAAGRGRKLDLAVVLDLDASLRLARGRVHLGVRRSPLRSAEGVLDLALQARGLGGVRVAGLMAYEAQIAGINDRARSRQYLNPLKRLIKALSKPDVLRRRGRTAELLRQQGFELELVNGGGTGSVDFTSSDPVVTEVTVGSGFFCSHLFSGYAGLELEPAAFFALQVVRASDPGLATCQGGGYAASGAAGADRLPQPFLPRGLELLPLEGAGEVQTPLRPTADNTEMPVPGDPVLLRHAKAGELMEHFNEVLLVAGDRIVDSALTYRGMGKCFL